jgi:MFS family permease
VTAATPTQNIRTWRTVVFLVFAVNGFGISAWVARIPSIRDRLDISVLDVGILIVGVSAGSILGLLAASHLVAWLGGRTTIRIALTVSGIALLVIGVGASVSGSFAVVIMGLALFGTCNSLCDVAMNVEGAGVERATGRTIMPWFHASWSIGTVIGAGIGSVAAFAKIDPVWHLGAVGLVEIVVTQIIVRYLPAHDAVVDEHGVSSASTFRQRMAIWLEPRTLLIGLIVLGMAFTEGSANDWLALAMVDDRGLDNGQGALLFGVFTVAMTAGRIVGVPLINRFGRVMVLRGSCGAAAIGLAMLIIVPAIPVAVLGIVLWGLGASLGFPLGMSAAGDDPSRASARVSAVATIGYLAFLGGPPLIGVVGEHIGLLNALWIVLGLILLAFLATPAARERAGRFARP